MLALPFVFVAVLLLLLFCRSELRTRTVCFLLLGLLIGLFPLLVFNVQHPLQNALVTLWKLHSAGESSQTGSLLWQSVLGTVLISLPMATGADPIYGASSTSGQWVHQISYMGFQGAWGVGVILLWTIAVFLAIKHLHGWRKVFTTSSVPAERQGIVRSSGAVCAQGGLHQDSLY